MSGFSVRYSLINRFSEWPPVCCMMKCWHIQPHTQPPHQSSPIVKNVKSFFVSLGISVKTTRFSSHFTKCHVQGFNGNLSDDEFSEDDDELDSFSGVSEDSDGIRPEELRRRRRIGRANRGKIPWNKGIKHSEETCQLIRLRTREALRDPKIRKKISEGHRPHSEHTRAKIGASQRRRWSQQTKWKKSKERFVQLWAESIAKYAKIGGIDQIELDWDSYEKINEEIALEQIQCKKEKAKAKEMAQIRAERAAKAKAEKIARIRQEQELKGKSPGESRNIQRKSKADKQELAIAQELKLKANLTKIRKKKRSNGQVTSQDSRTWEIIDPDLIRKDQIRKKVSLAEQIRAARKVKTQVMMSMNDLTASSFYPSSEDLQSELNTR